MSFMQYRKIPNADMKVSAVSLGTWVFGGGEWGEASDADSIRAAEEAIDKGVNLIDTAPIYGFGRSEEVVGRAVRGKRDRVLIATKCGLEAKGKSIGINLTASFIREDVENSLRRLGIDVIDLYQCHWPDKKTPLAETFGEMLKLKDEGKIRHIGVCNFGKDLLEKALQEAPIVSDQVQYSLFHRDIEKDLLPFCREKDVSILAYGSLGGGILTGKYKEPPKFPKGDVRQFFYKYYDEAFWGKAQEVIKVLEGIASARGVPVSQVAINWALSRKEVASAIAGCRNKEQADKNFPASNWELTEEELASIPDLA